MTRTSAASSPAFLKATLAASGLAVLPKTGHVVNLEEPDLFNALLGDFLACVDAGRWLARDPRTLSSIGPKPPWNPAAG